MAKKKSKNKKSKKKKKTKEKKKKKEKKGKEIGKVTHYFDNISVAVIKLKKQLKTGDKIRIKGSTTDFEEPVKSMQIEHEQVDKAGKGKSIGLKVKDKVRENDKVYKL